MRTVKFSSFRANAKSFFDKVFNDHEPMQISRSGGKDMVVMSLEDYESIEETMYLMQSPKNAEHLKRSLTQLKEGLTTKIDLNELDNL